MAKSWYVSHEGRVVGPATSTQLKRLAEQQKIHRDTRVRLGREGHWVRASKVQGLFPPTELVSAEPAIAPKALPSPSPIPTKPFVPQTKTCQFCGEAIASTAAKCRHCGEFLNHPIAAAAPQLQTVVNVTQVASLGPRPMRWNPVVAVLLSFLLPGLGQIYKGQVLTGIVWFVVVVIGYAVLVLPGLLLHVFCLIGAGMGDPYR